MKKEEIIKLIKERLRLETEVNIRDYGGAGDIVISLVLKGDEKTKDEKISEVCIDGDDIESVR